MKPMNVTAKHIQIKKASSTVFTAVVIASVIVSFSLVFLNILWGNAKYNTKVQEKLTTARDTLSDNLDKVNDLNTGFRTFEGSAKLIPDQEDNKSNAALVLDALPSRYDFPAVASSMSNLAARTNVTLRAFDGADLNAESPRSSMTPAPTEIPFSVTVEGTYVAVRDFLNGLQNSIRPMNVKTVNYVGSDGALVATFEVVTYYQPAFDTTISKEVIE